MFSHTDRVTFPFVAKHWHIFVYILIISFWVFRNHRKKGEFGRGTGGAGRYECVPITI